MSRAKDLRFIVREFHRRGEVREFHRRGEEFRNDQSANVMEGKDADDRKNAFCWEV